jgi:hypothetical protein
VLGICLEFLIFYLEFYSGGGTVIARVATFQVNIDKLEEVKKNFDQGIAPDAQKRKGFRSGYLLFDRKTGKCVSIGFWDSEKDVLDDEGKGHYQGRVDMVKDLFLKPFNREIYEVSSQY